MERSAVAFGENQVRPLTKRRVAAYARVSTDSDEQFTSFEAQVDYYTRQITANADWTMIEVYTDEGISGTNTKKREGFNRMISDALAGKFDLIITKSISRFARNTVDTLTAVRQLKEKGVEVYFEKENIYTMDSKGELLITIMSSLAQEESRSISENVAWGKRAKCEEGKVYLPYKQFLGYEKGPDGQPQIVEEQARTVRLIYALFLEGFMPSGVAKRLEGMGILSPAGKPRWQPGTVESILTNEKYKGDALLQKTFCVDFLTKKMKRNEGELPQYYVEQSHPAIVSPEVFDEVQQELKRRREVRYFGRSGCFSSKIICGECGSYFGRKV
ncbi:MAG: recombinase family protein, partial [Eubacteriales bacterium]|nr:recombinase family protein [Eubacteriales bacterium]